MNMSSMYRSQISGWVRKGYTCFSLKSAIKMLAREGATLVPMAVVVLVIVIKIVHVENIFEEVNDSSVRGLLGMVAVAIEDRLACRYSLLIGYIRVKRAYIYCT